MLNNFCLYGSWISFHKPGWIHVFSRHVSINCPSDVFRQWYTFGVTHFAAVEALFQLSTSLGQVKLYCRTTQRSYNIVGKKNLDIAYVEIRRLYIS